MSKQTKKQSSAPNRHTDVQQPPMRVAARLEGVIKNLGTKKELKEKQSDE